MASRAIFLIALLFAPLVANGDSQVSEPPPQVLQDLKTKVIYYLESDRRHVSAIGPEGKFLWCCQVILAPKNDFQRVFRIDRIELNGDDIRVVAFEGSWGVGTISKTTGVYSPPTVTQ
jgi:hypothetical protein